ncbi:hypothetical protein Tco_0674641 [Tanacetum coccineum]
MLSVVIRSVLGYLAFTVGTITGTPEVRPSVATCSNPMSYRPHSVSIGSVQSRQHDKSESVRSRKSPTVVLFDVDTGRISIHHCEMLKSTTLNLLARS